MADVDLRKLEQAAARGNLDAGERLLRERLRRGLLDPERIELAAYLGDEAALRLRPDMANLTELGEWLEGLARWGRAVTVRCAVAVARWSVASWSRP